MGTTTGTKCEWCEMVFPDEIMRESRFIGGPVCPLCDADEHNKTLGDIMARNKTKAIEYAAEQGA